MGKNMEKKRLVYPDVLRVLSIFAVVVLHTSASRWGIGTNIDSKDWWMMTLYCSSVRWCVPLFVMLSGMFFLDPNRPLSLKGLYQKNIWRIVKSFVFWSAFYVLFLAWLKDDWNRGMMVHNFLVGHYHLWFLYMIVGLYLVTPFLRLITGAGRRMMEYFLALCFVFGSCVATAVNMNLSQILNGIWGSMAFHMVLGYSGFFVAGYYLRTHSFGPMARRLIYVLGLVGLAATFWLTLTVSRQKGVAYSGYLSYTTPNVVVTSVAIFVFFKEWLGKRTFTDRAAAGWGRVSGAVFSVYLAHEIFNILLPRWGLTTVRFNPILSIPMISVMTFTFTLVPVLLWQAAVNAWKRRGDRQ